MFSEFENIDLTGLKVLVAEHDRLNLIRIYELLTSLGIQVVVTHKSFDIVEKNLIDNPDIILVNIEISDAKHTDAIRIIRKNEGPDRHIPIIGLTSGLHGDKTIEFKNTTPDDYLINTFIKEDLYIILEKYISKKISFLNSVNKKLETSTVVFNIKALKDFTNSDMAMMKNSLELFVKDIQELIIKLKVAIATGYFPEIEYFSYSIKSIAMNVFAEKLKNTAYHIEIIGASKDNSKVSEFKGLLTELENDFQETKNEIIKFLAGK